MDSILFFLVIVVCIVLGEIGRNGLFLIFSEGFGFIKLYFVESLLSRIFFSKEINKMKEWVI